MAHCQEQGHRQTLPVKQLDALPKWSLRPWLLSHFVPYLCASSFCAHDSPSKRLPNIHLKAKNKLLLLPKAEEWDRYTSHGDSPNSPTAKTLIT